MRSHPPCRLAAGPTLHAAEARWARGGRGGHNPGHSWSAPSQRRHLTRMSLPCPRGPRRLCPPAGNGHMHAGLHAPGRGGSGREEGGAKGGRRNSRPNCQLQGQSPKGIQTGPVPACLPSPSFALPSSSWYAVRHATQAEQRPDGPLDLFSTLSCCRNAILQAQHPPFVSLSRAGFRMTCEASTLEVAC